MRKFFLDPWLIGPILILVVFSLIVLRSVIPEESGRQIIFAAAGLLAFLIFAQIDYRIFGELARFLYILAILSLVFTFIFGQVTRGSVRWIEIGPLTIQPSEFIKPVMILFLSYFAHAKNLKRIRNLALFALLTALPVLLVFFQPDLGSSLVLIVIGFSIAFTAGVSLKAFLGAFGALAFSLPLIYKLLKPYQQDRLRAFVDPFSDPLGSGYHVIQSMIAVGSGKLLGRGLGHGTQSQLRFLPERHSDFIFASLAEELGFVGTLLVLGSYFVLLLRLLSSIFKESDPVGNYILTGVFAMLLFQAGVSIGMNLGLMPITGITLPLLSSGGSSMISVMISLGIAQSVIRSNKPRGTIEIR